MAINWFEGGRRIRNLLIGACALGGAVYSVWVETPTVYLARRVPEEAWRWSTMPCEYPSVSQDVESGLLVDGKAFNLGACFEANEEGRIMYAPAPPPEPDPTKPPPIVRTGFEPKWYFTGRAYEPAVSAYIERRKIKVTRNLLDSAAIYANGAKANLRRAKFSKASEVFAVVAIFLWVATLALGWIVRGFAGIPNGKDFRPSS